MTAKSVDTTVISASLREIRSIDLLGLTTAIYEVYTSRDVHRELEDGFDLATVERISDSIQVVDVDHDVFGDLMDWLERRYPYLHRGELSSFLLTVVNFGLRGRPCYYVTDDGAMRRRVRNILIEDRFIELLGEEPPQIQMTGTVGLVVGDQATGLRERCSGLRYKDTPTTVSRIAADRACTQRGAAGIHV